MLRTSQPRVGLCSVTFRQLSADDIVGAAVAAGLESIEWGADVHAPIADLAEVRRVGDITRAAGLTVCSYGSYFRCDDSTQIEPLLAAAQALGAPRIRVWAGHVGSADASAVDRAHTIAILQQLARDAAALGIEIALEFHGGTLTDDRSSALEVLSEAPGVSAYWQPANGAPDDEALADLNAIGARTSTAHVFSWASDGSRLRLVEREPLWRRALSDMAAFGTVTDLLLEFVADNDPTLLPGEGAQLRAWRDELFTP